MGWNLKKNPTTTTKSYKSAGVVVPQRLGVAEGLQQRVGLQDDVFDMLRGNRGNELLAASLAHRKEGLRTLRTSARPGLSTFLQPLALKHKHMHRQRGSGLGICFRVI